MQGVWIVQGEGHDCDYSDLWVFGSEASARSQHAWLVRKYWDQYMHGDCPEEDDVAIDLFNTHAEGCSYHTSYKEVFA